MGSPRAAGLRPGAGAGKKGIASKRGDNINGTRTIESAATFARVDVPELGPIMNTRTRMTGSSGQACCSCRPGAPRSRSQAGNSSTSCPTPSSAPWGCSSTASSSPRTPRSARTPPRPPWSGRSARIQKAVRFSRSSLTKDPFAGYQWEFNLVQDDSRSTPCRCPAARSWSTPGSSP